MGPFSMRRARPVLLAAAVCCAAWLAWASLPDSEPAPGLALPALASALREVDRIEIRHGGDLLTLERRGQLWFLAQHGGYPADSAKAMALLDSLAAMRLHRRATGVLEALGLDDPSKPGSPAVMVRALTVRGITVAALVLGTAVAGLQAVRHPDDFQAWLASPPAAADTVLAHWTDPLILPANLAAVAGVVVDRPDLAPQPLPAAQGVNLGGLAFQDVRPAPQLRAVARGTAHYTLADDTAVDIAVGEAEGQTWLQLAATGPAAEAIRRRVQGWAFAVPGAATRLLPPPEAP